MSEFLRSIPLEVFLPIVLWDFIWKMIALWKAARNSHLTWFIFIGIVNSVGILPLIYIVLDNRRKKKITTQP
ncbi:MAG TPA: hypothetical protein DEP22_09605 [Porphyromonadaceae bacterium]|nr:hypothetical protein [Porphyromonadaceae bacterium]